MEAGSSRQVLIRLKDQIKVNFVSNYLGMAVDKCRFQETFCSSKDYNEVQPESRQVSDPLHANDETFRIKNVEKIDFFLVLKSKKSSTYIRAGKFRNIFPYYDSKITYCVCSV